MIEVTGLRYTYEGGNTISFPDISVESGEPCLLLGESGSGKTTLLHLVGGLLRIQQGVVKINGTELSGLSEAKLDKFRGQHIGFIFQKNHLITALTVRDNLLLAPYLGGLKPNKTDVDDVLKEVGLGDKANSKVTALSHGQAQRVAIARAVLNKPGIILADEPTSALDDKNCSAVIEMLLSIASNHNTALLIATHDQRLKSKIPRQIIL